MDTTKLEKFARVLESLGINPVEVMMEALHTALTTDSKPPAPAPVPAPKPAPVPKPAPTHARALQNHRRHTPDILTSFEVATLVGCSSSHVSSLVKYGVIPMKLVMPSKRRLYFEEEKFKAWLSTNPDLTLYEEAVKRGPVAGYVPKTKGGGKHPKGGAL